MAGKSSATRMRLCSGVMGGRGRMAGKIEGEGGAEAGSIALDLEGAAEEAGGVGGVVEAEAVTACLGGEAVAEDGEELVGVDADAVVDDADGQVGDGGGAYVDAEQGNGSGGGGRGKGGAGVGEKVDEDLHDSAAVGMDGGGAFAGLFDAES